MSCVKPSRAKEAARLVNVNNPPSHAGDFQRIEIDSFLSYRPDQIGGLNKFSRNGRLAVNVNG
jgi:hypothetical protein